MGAAVRGMVTGISKVTVTDGDRCERLGKDCVSSVSIRKLTSRRAPGSRTTQIEHLENKIEDLVTLLRNQIPEKSNTHANLDAIGIRTPATSTNSSYSESVAYDFPAGVDGGNATLYASTKHIDQVLSDADGFPALPLDKPSDVRSPVEPSLLQAEVGLLQQSYPSQNIHLVMGPIIPGYFAENTCYVLAFVRRWKG